MMSEFEPKIVAFFCNWCTYGAADLAGVSRLEYPPNFRVVRLPCTGRLNPKYILEAFKRGADGVWVSGCHPGDCHYIAGNYHARRKFMLLHHMIEAVGVEPGRLHFSWISSAEATKFQEVAKEVVEKVRACGPNVNFRKAELNLGLPEVA
ncbi:MAG: hydrogenase iron-sulfur subunit [Candidatus Adiutrix sp.]|nr:hydrogenase iron-sulfur subunit [Candidatus Adiutrix sp.]